MIELQARDIRRLDWFGLKHWTARLLGSRLLNPLLRTAAKLIPIRYARRLPLSVPYADYRLASGLTIRLLSPAKDKIARDIYWGGGKPTKPAERRKLLLIEELSKRASTFLDVGTYAGICSLVAARANPELRVVAYDIVPENHALTVRNMNANGLADRAEVKLCGISDSPGSVLIPATMNTPTHLPSISLGSHFNDGVSVPVCTLDDETRSLEGPFLVKLDVEGFEDRAVAGGLEFIRKHRPDIICEILPGEYPNIRSLLDGYRFFVIEGGDLIERPSIEPERGWRDWLFTHSPP